MRHAHTPLITLLSIVAFLALSACTDTSPDQQREPRDWRLQTHEVSPQPFTHHHLAIGTVVAATRIDISSTIAAYIRELPVDEGDPVTQGQLLVQLDDSSIDSGVRQARAAVQTARARERELAADLERYKTLADQNSIATARVRQMGLQHRTALQQLDAARAALTAAEAQRNYSRIMSPVNGVISARHRQPGDLASPGMPILTLQSQDALEFETHIPESVFAALAPGAPVDLEIADKRLLGTISQINQVANSHSHQYKIKIALPAASSLRVGMFGRARLAIGEYLALSVPPSALLNRGGVDGVFVVEQQRAFFRWTRFKHHDEGPLEITSGLRAGDRVILTPPRQLREDDTITAPKSG